MCIRDSIDIVRNEKEVSCAVEKDGGDDPDITTGALIYAKVSYGALPLKEKQERPQIVIDGGMGVGRVTKPGLDQPVGNAAINHVPVSYTHLMCADNGIVEENVSQSGQEITAAVAKSMGKGQSCVGQMAKAVGADTIPVDIGTVSYTHLDVYKRQD